MNNQEVKNRHIKTRDKVESLLNKNYSVEEISKRLEIKTGHALDKGSINWYKKCIVSKLSMQKRHKEHPEIFTRKRLNLNEEKIKEMYLSKEMPPHKIAKIMKCDTMTIFNRLREMDIKIRGYSESHKLKTYAGLKKVKNCGLTPEKAYILGVLCGDGWISYGNRMYTIGLRCIDKDFVEEFRRNIKIVYGVNCKIRSVQPRKKNWSNQYVSCLFSKLACEDILSYGCFKGHNWRVPTEILNSKNIGLIGNFLRGFYDSEGHVNSRWYTLKATTSNKEGFLEILGLLKKLKIHYITKLKKHRNKKYKIGLEVLITGSDSYKKFKEYVGFSIKRKQDNLLKLQNIRPQKRYTKEDFEKALKLKKEGLRVLAISRKIGVIHSTVSKWLRDEEHYSKLFNQDDSNSINRL
ncbi:MAG: hypothetical protein ISS82_02170 [Nanoarchaeota archaeon]|nr:hypothetical protein [Nanoarchaeota archaeon]